MNTAATRWQPMQCRLCSTVLTALQRLRGDICQRLDCQRLAARERARQRRDATLAAQRARAAQRWQQPAVADVPVLWLERHATELVQLPAAVRRAQLAHLARLAAEVDADPQPPQGAPVLSDGSTPLAGALCGFCGGRCCRYGAGTHGFVTAELLRRWMARHPGRSAAEAAAAYAERLPRWHVARSCCHHGRDGCTLPEAMRSDICNRYACDTLRGVQDRSDAPALVVAMQRDVALGEVALLQPGGFRRLPKVRAARR
ncbi:hypothetical protein ACPOLB_18255 [Rubrivivax sp. RP6-9]|uniref:hypothetical protein n=1 Tax=Rubrivivax sp. RP6-9 TaxID=3415750 RepID=UPI003CC57B0C